MMQESIFELEFYEIYLQLLCIDHKLSKVMRFKEYMAYVKQIFLN